MASENLLELVQQRSPLLQSRGPQRHPSVSPTANPTELKTQKSEALALLVQRSYRPQRPRKVEIRKRAVKYANFRFRASATG
jgi:hypothetical protein